MFSPRQGQRYFYLVHCVESDSAASYPMGTGGPSRVQRSGRQANHSPAPIAKVKNDGAIPPPAYIFIPWGLINYFTFHFYDIHKDPPLNQILSQMYLFHVYLIRENVYLNIFIPFYLSSEISVLSRGSDCHFVHSLKNCQPKVLTDFFLYNF